MSYNRPSQTVDTAVQLLLLLWKCLLPLFT